MKRTEFLDLIFEFYKVKDDDDSLKKIYDTALSTNVNINWQSLYMNVIKTSESRYLPPPKWFISKFAQFTQYDDNELAGGTIKVIRKDGKSTLFTVCTGDNLLTLENVKKTFNGIESILFYDKNVSFIGDKPFPQNASYRVIL